MADIIQEKIDKMVKGDKQVIEESINSESLPLIVNAIISGMRYGVKSSIFYEGLKKATKRNEIMMGCQISQLAIAACHLLGIEKYDGDDERIKQYIECRMKF